MIPGAIADGVTDDRAAIQAAVVTANHSNFTNTSFLRFWVIYDTDE